jgi:penicillin-binding protein 1A
MPEEILPPPDGIVSARIDPATGLLAQPEQENAIFEVFRADTVPTEMADGNQSPGNENNEGEEQLF